MKKNIKIIGLLIIILILSINTLSYAKTETSFGNKELVRMDMTNIQGNPQEAFASNVIGALRKLSLGEAFGSLNVKQINLQDGTNILHATKGTYEYDAYIEVSSAGNYRIALLNKIVSNKINTPSEPNTSQDPINNPDFYNPTDKTGENTRFIEIGNIIIGTIRAIGTIIAVVAFMVIGIRYMFGSLYDRASYKETMIPYLIGAIMLFIIPNVLGIIYDIVKGITF